MYTCDPSNLNQQWQYDSSTGQIKNRHGICLDASQRSTIGGKVLMYTCDPSNPNQQWDYDSSNGQIKNRHGICLDASQRSTIGGKVHMYTCDPSDPNQQWDFDSLSTIVSVSGTVNVAATFAGNSKDCDCDRSNLNGKCAKEDTVIRVELSGGNDDNAVNLKACIGECDSDDQCASGLECFQRSNGETIPGCKGLGGGKDWDYCYNPTWTVNAYTPTKSALKFILTPVNVYGVDNWTVEPASYGCAIKKQITRWNCAQKCAAKAGCKSFTWFPQGGQSVCLLRDGAAITDSLCPRAFPYLLKYSNTDAWFCYENSNQAGGVCSYAGSSTLHTWSASQPVCDPANHIYGGLKPGDDVASCQCGVLEEDAKSVCLEWNQCGGIVCSEDMYTVDGTSLVSSICLLRQDLKRSSSKTPSTFYLVTADTFTTGDNLNILKTENICQAIDDGCKSASGKCAKCDTYGYECDAALSAQENCQAWCTMFSGCKLIFL